MLHTDTQCTYTRYTIHDTPTRFDTPIHDTRIRNTPVHDTPVHNTSPCGCSSLSGLTILLCSDGLSISLWQATGVSTLKTDKTHWRFDSYLVIDPSLIVWTRDNYSTPVFSPEMVIMRPMPLMLPQITPVRAHCLAAVDTVEKRGFLLGSLLVSFSPWCSIWRCIW